MVFGNGPTIIGLILEGGSTSMLNKLLFTGGKSIIWLILGFQPQQY